MAIKAEKIVPRPVEIEVVIRLSERAAGELMSTLMNELTWHMIEFGTTVGDVYNALEDAGVKEA